MTKAIFFTGLPGIGKTTVLLRTIKVVEESGYRVGGMVTEETREHGVRVGFALIDLLTHKRGWLAHVTQPSGPSVGRYRVNLEDLNTVGVKAIEQAEEDPAVALIAIDEVGPMELYSSAFKEVIRRVLRGPKPVVGVIHYRVRDPIIDEVRSLEDIEVMEVTYANREVLPQRAAEKVLRWVKSTK